MSTSVPLPVVGARPGAALLAALACAGATVCAAPAAVAASGDHGVVKVHSVSTPLATARNDARVCEFYLAGYDFDGIPEITWAITPQTQNMDTRGLSGAISLAGGTGRTANLQLPDGRYRLTWNFEGQTEAGERKLFTVDCTAQTGAAAGGSAASGSLNGERKSAKGAPQTTGEDGGGAGSSPASDAPSAASGAVPSPVYSTMPEDDSVIAQDRLGDVDPGEALGDQGASASGADDSLRPPRGPVGAGGGGVSGADRSGPSATLVAGTLVAGAAGTAGLVLMRRSRRRAHGAA